MDNTTGTQWRNGQYEGIWSMWQSYIFRKWCWFWPSGPLSCQNMHSKIQKIWRWNEALYRQEISPHMDYPHLDDWEPVYFKWWWTTFWWLQWSCVILYTSRWKLEVSLGVVKLGVVQMRVDPFSDTSSLTGWAFFYKQTGGNEKKIFLNLLFHSKF